MTYTSSVTQKGQVTIPQEIRKHLKLKPSDKVFFIRNKENVILKPSRSFIDMEGSVKHNVKYSDFHSDKQVSDYISMDYEEAPNS